MLGTRRRFRARAVRAFAEAENAGDFSAIEALCAEAKAEPALEKLALAALATVARRRGDFDGAIEILGKAAANAGKLRDTLTVELAACYALKGVTGAAMTWLPELRGRRTGQAASYAIVWARTGKAGEVHRLKLKKPVIEHDRRILRMVRGFALWKNDPTDDRALVMVGDATPAFDGELDYLGSSWPKMAEFARAVTAPKQGPV